MNHFQRTVAFEYAANHKRGAEIVIDADVDNNTGFDEVPDGVWVRAWVKVPADYIPLYSMTPPAPAATVKPAKWPHQHAYHPHLNTDSSE